jgi:hypothetical protein
MGLSYNPSIVVDGLQYALDVANPKCYSGSGNTTFDLTGRITPGALTNAPTYNSNLGGFFSFDGTNDYLAVPDSNLLDLGANFTISAWIKLNDLSTKAFSGIFGATDVNTNVATLGYYFMWYRDNIYGINAKSLMLQFGKNAWGWNVYSSDTNTINDLNIHHVAVTISAANTNNPAVSFYLDGVLKNTTWWGSSAKAAINYASDVSSVRLAHVFSPSNTSYLNVYGSLNVYNLQVYKKVLSATEISQNYNANRGRYLYNADIATNGLILNLDPGNYISYPGSGSILYDVSGNGRIHTMTSIGYSSANNGTIQYTSSSYSSTSMGSTINVQGPWSVDIWLKYTSNSYAGTTFAINNEYSVWQFAIRNNTGDIWTYGGTSQLTYPLPVVGVWNHYALTLSSNILKLYINGSLYATKVVTSQTGGASDFVIGDYRANNSGNENYLGFIGPVKLYNRVITQAEVTQNYDTFRGRF